MPHLCSKQIIILCHANTRLAISWDISTREAEMLVLYQCNSCAFVSNNQVSSNLLENAECSFLFEIQCLPSPRKDC